MNTIMLTQISPHRKSSLVSSPIASSFLRRIRRCEHRPPSGGGRRDSGTDAHNDGGEAPAPSRSLGAAYAALLRQVVRLMVDDCFEPLSHAGTDVGDLVP